VKVEENTRTYMPDPDSPSEAAQTARFLHARQIAMIEEALASLGPFGEVRLVVENGRLRFVVTSKSFDALRYHPGQIQKTE
jgi:hypothetical protein